MSEVIPQFTYNDSLLHVTVLAEHDPDEWKSAHTANMLTLLGDVQGVDISEQPYGHSITANLSPFLKKAPYTSDDTVKLEKLLASISRLLPYRSETDIGIGLSTISHGGIVADIYPSAQIWFQNEGISQDIRTESSGAMGSVFGVGKTKKAITHWDVAIALDLIEFEVAAFESDEQTTTEKSSLVTLRVPFLQTIGNCACLGSNASERKIYLDNQSPYLYSLESHNVDSLRETLSLILGLGSIAAHLPSEYDEGALFSGVNWRERTFPKNW